MTEPKPTKKQLDFEDEYRELQMKALRIANNKTLADAKMNRQRLAYDIVGSYDKPPESLGFDKYKELYKKAYKMLENL